MLVFPDEDQSAKIAAQISDLCAWSRANIAGLTQAKIIAKSGYSASWLRAHFHKVAGMNLRRFIEVERVAVVKHLFSHTMLTRQQIADVLHYSSADKMDRTFKRNTGMTPNEYRRQHYAPAADQFK